MAESYYESLQNDVINSFGGVTAGANDAVKFEYDVYGTLKPGGTIVDIVNDSYFYNMYSNIY